MGTCQAVVCVCVCVCVYVELLQLTESEHFIHDMRCTDRYYQRSLWPHWPITLSPATVPLVEGGQARHARTRASIQMQMPLVWQTRYSRCRSSTLLQRLSSVLDAKAGAAAVIHFARHECWLGW